MNYILIFTLILIVFFLGFGMGITIPFLLKKYFNLSESNFNHLKRIEDYCNQNIYDLNQKINKLNCKSDSINNMENTLNDLVVKLENMTKPSNLDSNVINEWLYGKNGGDINESS